MPIRPVEEVDEVDPQRLLGLAHLPVEHTTGALQIVAEVPDLVRHGFVRRRARKELPDPAYKVRSGALAYQLALQEELAELLQRGLGLSHRCRTIGVVAYRSPFPRGAAKCLSR